MVKKVAKKQKKREGIVGKVPVLGDVDTKPKKHPKVEKCGRCHKPKTHEVFAMQCQCGRPSIYTQEILDKAKKYVEKCEDEDIIQVTGMTMRGTELYKTKVRVNFPSIEGLAFEIKISKDTIYEWEKLYPKFSDVIVELRAKQAKRLLEGGLSGDYNPTIAKVILTKHGYRDSTEVFTNEVPIDEEAKKRGDEAVAEYLKEKKK